MRNYTCFITGLAVTVGVVGSAHAISLLDYTFPTSTTQQAYVNGTFNANGTSADTTQVGFTLGGSGNYWLALRSLPFSYDVSLGASISTSRSTIDGASTEDAWDINMATNLDKYFNNEDNFFVYGGASADYRRLILQDEADDPRIDVEAGLGFGRTINATVLKQAVRMDEDFVKYGITTRGMPDAALLKLAAVIDRESEFRSRYGPVEYRKYWYGEMESVLQDAGVLATETMGAMGTLRIQEVMAEPTAQRWHGWQVHLGVGSRISDYNGSSGDPALTARLDWHRPVGMDLQFSNKASIATVFADDLSYNLEDLFRVDYEISNRIDWYNSLMARIDIPTATDAENVTEVTLASTFILYLENRLSFNPEIQFNYRDDGIVDAEWNWVLLGGITYRLK